MSSNTSNWEKDLKSIDITNIDENEISKFETFKGKNKKILDDNLVILKELNSILKKCSYLSPKQKLDYCNSQRYFMKMFLRDINRK